ncbi:MAG: hypothetical protein U0228_39420 [Myxococcaceae bacterium]
MSFSACKSSSSTDSGTAAAAPTEAQVLEADLAALPHAGGSLVDQLAAELAARPKGTPTLEGVLAAVAPQGVSFNAPRQVFGQKQYALYCASADSVDGLVLTVCEYPGEAQAARGEKAANVVQGQLARHQSRVRRQSVLHVVPRSDTPEDTVKKVLGAFESL